ncbi:pleckstrin homology domain-containing protein 1 [Phtheirospermum japonicum]|uniref:Pleckstrin homology domain-containing protein 1 n=2 Tax=Phtheirospermum japonicum TaxID=374723 RepID=A0A830CZI0_9LAMI|nr:pleckstrin homology domain-containing protein 1 [Phtheirospermum japonicum]
MASRDGLGLSRRRRLLRRGVLGTPRARRLAHEARRVHQDLAPPLVRPEAEQGLLVQGIDGHPRLQATWRYPGGQLPHRQGRRRRAPSPIHIRVVDLDRDDVLHRQFGEGEGGLDQFYWEIYCSALQVRYCSSIKIAGNKKIKTNLFIFVSNQPLNFP